MIGIVGGSGDFGQGIAARLRALGEDVVIGSRTPREEFVSNTEACERSDLIFLCVPAENAEAMARELGEGLAGHVVVSVASSLRLREGESLAEQTAAAAPGARVVAGFHTVSATLLKDLEHTLDEDVLLCGDDDEAKATVSKLAKDGGLRPIDVGPLALAHLLRAIDFHLAPVKEVALVGEPGRDVAMGTFHARWDLLVTPTLPIAAFPAGRETPEGSAAPHWPGWTPFTYPFNLTQQPAASVPCGLTEDGLPVGLHVVGARHADALVLRFCKAYQDARPWTQRVPPLDTEQ